MLTNSQLRAGRECLRREHLEYDLGLEPIEKPEYIKFGSAFHAARDGADIDAMPLDPFLRESVRAVSNAFTDPVDVIAREVKFEIDLVNPDTDRAAQKETLGGIIDVVGRYQGRLVIVDYKTTSDFGPDYFARLVLDTQPLTYWIGARELGYDVTGVLYCVVRRPALRPLKATPVEARKYTKAGALYANQRLVDESPAEYGARVAVHVAENPYFMTREVAVLSDDVYNHQRDLWSQYQMRLFMRRGGFSPFRNPAACDGCWFVACCAQNLEDGRVPDGYLRRDPLERYAGSQSGTPDGGQPVSTNTEG